MSLVQNLYRIKIGNDVETSNKRRFTERSPSSSSSSSSSSITSSFFSSLTKRGRREKQRVRGGNSSTIINTHKNNKATNDNHRNTLETTSITSSYSASMSDSESDTSHESSLDALVQRALSIPQNRRSSINLHNIPLKQKRNDINHMHDNINNYKEKQNREDKFDSDSVDVVSARNIGRDSNKKQINKRENVNYKTSHDDVKDRSASRYKFNGKLSLAINSSEDEYNTNYNNRSGNDEDDHRFTRMLEELRLNAEQKQEKFNSNNSKNQTPEHQKRVDKDGKWHVAVKFDKATEARLTALNASTRAKKQEKYEVRKAKEKEEEENRNKVNREHHKSNSQPSKRSIEAGERLYRLATSQQALLTRMRNEAQKEENKVITKELTFKPIISKMAQELGSKDYQPLSLRASAEFNTQMQRRRHSQLAQESRKLRQCTFHPTLAPFTEQLIHARRQKEMRRWCARHTRKSHNTLSKTHRHSPPWRSKQPDTSVMHHRTSSFLSTPESSESSSAINAELSHKQFGKEKHNNNNNKSKLHDINNNNSNKNKRNAYHRRRGTRNHNNTSCFSSHSPFKESFSFHHHHHHSNSKGHEKETSHLHLDNKKSSVSVHPPPSHSHRALLSSSLCHEPFDPAERLYHDGEERLLRQQIRQQMELDRAEAEMIGNHIKLSRDELQEVLARMEDWLNKRNQRVELMREYIIRSETTKPEHTAETVQRSASCAPRIGANNTIISHSSLPLSSPMEQNQQEEQYTAKTKHDPLRRSATEFTHLQPSNTHQQQQQLHKSKKEQRQERLWNEKEITLLPKHEVHHEETQTHQKYDGNKLQPTSKNTIYKNGAAMAHPEALHLSHPPVLTKIDKSLTNIASVSNRNNHIADVTSLSPVTISPVSESSESTSAQREITSLNTEQKQEHFSASCKEQTMCVKHNDTQWTEAQWELRVIRYGALFYKYLPSTRANTVRLSEIELQVHRIYPEDVDLLAVLQSRFALPETVIDKDMFVSALTEFERQNGPQPWGWTEKDRLLYNPVNNFHSSNGMSGVYPDSKKTTVPATVGSTTHHAHQDSRTNVQEQMPKSNKVNTSIKWEPTRMPHAIRASNTPVLQQHHQQERISRTKKTNLHDDKCTFRPKLNKRSIQLSYEDKRKRAMKMHTSLEKRRDMPNTIGEHALMPSDFDKKNIVDSSDDKNYTHSTDNAQSSTMLSAQVANETKRASSSSHRAGLSPSVELSSLSSTEEYELLNSNNDIEKTKLNKVSNAWKTVNNTLHSSAGEWQHTTKATHDAVAELEYLLQSTQERVNALMELERVDFNSDNVSCTNATNVTHELLPLQTVDLTQFPHHSSKWSQNKKISNEKDNSNMEKCLQEQEKMDHISPPPSKPQLTIKSEGDKTKRLTSKHVESNNIMTDTFDSLFDSLYKSCSRSAKRS